MQNKQGGKTAKSSLVFEWRDAVVHKQSGLSGPCRWVLWQLSTFMRHDGSSAFPSQALLASRCGYSERTVFACIAIAEKEGWVVKRRRERAQHAHLQSLCYRPMIPDRVREIMVVEARIEFEEAQENVTAPPAATTLNVTAPPSGVAATGANVTAPPAGESSMSLPKDVKERSSNFPTTGRSRITEYGEVEKARLAGRENDVDTSRLEEIRREVEGLRRRKSLSALEARGAEA